MVSQKQALQASLTSGVVIAVIGGIIMDSGLEPIFGAIMIGAFTAIFAYWGMIYG
jgi:hypothetical protein